MTVHYHQRSLAETFKECQELLVDNTASFFLLLKEHLAFDSFIPHPFYTIFYKNFKRKHDYPLHGFLSALILQKIFSFPSDVLFLVFLSLCKELCAFVLLCFCDFDKVPNALLLTRLKQDFSPFLEQMIFEDLFGLTKPICQSIDDSLSTILSFNISNIERYVTKNNPKYFNSLLNQVKTTYKNKPNIKPLNMVYGLMTSPVAVTSTDAKQLYINGYFCYLY